MTQVGVLARQRQHKAHGWAFYSIRGYAKLCLLFTFYISIFCFFFAFEKDVLDLCPRYFDDILQVL